MANEWLAFVLTKMTWFIPTPNYIEMAVDEYWNSRARLFANIPGSSPW